MQNEDDQLEIEEDVPTLIEPGTEESEGEAKPIETAVPSTSAGSVPLTIISGFLGAGKSTLVKRILTERHGYRIAVIMNEFGDTADIEAKTINVSSPDDPAQQSEEFLELPNGCLCCSIKDSGVAAIEKLMQRKGTFDHILLETTGLADPGPIASIFWQNEEYAMGLGRDIHLDGVVCVVDAVFGRQQIEENHDDGGINESLRQIASADVVLLNKVDIAPAPEVEAIEAVIRGINPAATLYKTIRSNIDLKCIMGIDAYTSSRPLAQNLSDPLPNHTHEAGHEHGEDDPTHAHCHPPIPQPTHYELRGVSSLQITFPILAPSSLQLLDEWIRTVLWENRLPEDPPTDTPGSETQKLEVLRCKGMFGEEGGKTYVLQGVRSLYEISEVKGSGHGDVVGVPEIGKVVLIGKGLDQRVRESLERVLGRY